MSFESIIQAIQKKELPPVTFVCGEEPYYIDEVMKAADQILTESEKDFNQVTLYGKDTNKGQVIDQLMQYPMMAPKRIVLLKEAQMMREFDKLLSYFEKPVPHTAFFIGYKGKTNGRKKIFSTLKNQAVYYESAKIKEYKMAEWISNYIRGKKRLIHPDNAQRLADLLGNDLSKVINAVEKLILVIPEGEQVSYDAINEQISLSKDFNIFEFQDAIATKNLSKSILIADYFAENPSDHPIPRLVAGMYTYFSKVFMTKANLQLDNSTLAKKINVFSPAIAGKYKTAAKNYSVKQLEKIFEILLTTDKASKGVGQRNATNQSLLRDLVAGIMIEK